MDFDRRIFLTIGAGLPTLAARPARPPADADARVCLVTNGASRPLDIVGVFEELGLACDVVDAGAAEKVEPGEFALLWIASTSYPHPGKLSSDLSAKVKRFLENGRGVFAEYVTNFPGVPASDRLEKVDLARLFVVESLPLDGATPSGTILDEHDSMCLPLSGGATGCREVLAFGEVKGVQRVIPNFQPKETWTGLLWGKRGTGCFALATTQFSEFRRRQYAPVVRWEGFLRELVLALLPAQKRAGVLKDYIPLRVHTEPRAWITPGSEYKVVAQTSPGSVVELLKPVRKQFSGEKPSETTLVAGQAGVNRVMVKATRNGRTRSAEVALRVSDRRAAYLRSLERNVRWFERSGALVKPDGTRGVHEWISRPDMDGQRVPFGRSQLYDPERQDCNIQSGLAFWLYGAAANSARHRRIGENILVRIMDFQRLDRGDPGYGLWSAFGRGGRVFQNSCSWGTIGCLAAYRYTKNEMFRHRGLISAKAQARAYGPDDRLRVPSNAPAGCSDGIRTEPMTQKANRWPFMGGYVLAAWLYTYGMTGETSYLDLALPMLRDMAEGFDSLPSFGVSRTCESIRFLLPLSLAVAYTGDSYFRKILATHADYLRSRMDPCGAIREEGSNVHTRDAAGDLGLTFDQGETISDQLYGTSFASLYYWLAYKATGDKVYLNDFQRLTDYLVRIQIESQDPMTDGGWMRAFDYSVWEYYGSNADQWWGPYVMETGWTNAIIDMAIGLYLLDDTFYQPRVFRG